MKSEELLTRDLAQIRKLRVEDFADRNMSDAEIKFIFGSCDALWLHSGDPEHPHAELTSGKCSNGFVDVLRVLKHTNLCEIFAAQLIRKLGNVFSAHPYDWVIGSDHAGATLSYAVAAQLGLQHDFTEKGMDEISGRKLQVWKRFSIQPDERVLQVEELVTTTGTLRAVREGIRTGNPTPVLFAPLVAILVHRSDENKFEEYPILYLIHFDIQTWKPEECPLCAAGSKRLRPKTNWAELTGKG